MNDLNLFMRLSKVDEATRTVSGIATAEVLDKSGEIMDYESTVPYYKAWSEEFRKNTEAAGQEISLGNIRTMHGKSAAGKVVDIEYDDLNKTIRITAEIVDDQDWIKCKKGVYTGFSQGGAYIKRWNDPSNSAVKRYTANPAEISIVDNPCVGIATFDYVKADGTHELRKFQVTKDAETDLKQVWLAKDGSTHDKKADALQKNLDLAVTTAVDVIEPAMAALQKAKDALAAKEPEVDAPADDATKVTPPAADPVAKVEDAPVAKTDAEKAAGFAAAVKKAVLAKQLCDIPQVVSVIASLQWLQSDLEWDTLFDDAEVSTLPTDLKAILSSLCAFLKAMVDDATADITEDASKALTFEQVDALRKYTGRDILPDVKAPELEKIESADTEALMKIQGELDLSKAREAALEKTIGDLTSGIDEISKRIEHLEAQPAPAKGIKGATTVLKGHEGAASGADTIPVEDLALKYSHLPPEQARAKVKEEMAKLGQ